MFQIGLKKSLLILSGSLPTYHGCLSCATPVIFTQGSAHSDHPVAGYQEGHRIIPDSRSDSPECPGMVYFFCYLTVCCKFSQWYLEQGLPHLDLEIGALEPQAYRRAGIGQRVESRAGCGLVLDQVRRGPLGPQFLQRRRDPPGTRAGPSASLTTN